MLNFNVAFYFLKLVQDMGLSMAQTIVLSEPTAKYSAFGTQRNRVQRTATDRDDDLVRA